MRNIIGRFYFKLTDSKNLIGEFSNNTSLRNFTESADRREDSDGGDFAGTYLTTWHEAQTTHSVLANLEINLKPDCTNIFKLEWTESGNNNFMFYGEGFLCDGMLIGDYRNFREV